MGVTCRLGVEEQVLVRGVEREAVHPESVAAGQTSSDQNSQHARLQDPGSGQSRNMEQRERENETKRSRSNST